jgi:hypothetical protein
MGYNSVRDAGVAQYARVANRLGCTRSLLFESYLVQRAIVGG